MTWQQPALPNQRRVRNLSGAAFSVSVIVDQQRKYHRLRPTLTGCACWLALIPNAASQRLRNTKTFARRAAGRWPCGNDRHQIPSAMTEIGRLRSAGKSGEVETSAKRGIDGKFAGGSVENASVKRMVYIGRASSTANLEGRSGQCGRKRIGAENSDERKISGAEETEAAIRVP